MKNTFVGRTEELKAMERLYNKQRFQMVVIYGRRRIGKTALIAEFCKNKETLWFTAREQSSAINLREFSHTIYRFFNEPANPSGFPNWDSAIQYIAAQAKRNHERRFVFVFDEFPYAAAVEPGLPSIMQIAIDHQFQETNVMMILCGSNEGFMESHVLGYKSPLYGRRTGQIRLKPFDIFEASKLMPADASWIDKVHYYSALGGTPYYLNQIDSNESFQDNLTELCFNQSGLLYEEPMMLLREELRDPTLYNSILEAIASGKTKPKTIGDQVGMDSTALSPYLNTLSSLGLVERSVPFGERADRSKKGLWKIKDPFFDYWYRFVSPRTGLIDMGQGEASAVIATQGGVFETYVGQQFEKVCSQWVFQQCKLGRLDFLPTSSGKWWGTDSKKRLQTDVDVVMADSVNDRMLFGECKWKESLNENEAVENLIYRSTLISGCENRLYYLFTKYPVKGILRQQHADDVTFVSADGMFL